MSHHITEQLVEAIARARVDAHAAHFGSLPAADRAGIPDFALKSWEEQDQIAQHGVREAVLGQLNGIIPHLLAAGWAPPACDSCQHQHGTGVCGSDLGGDSICWCQTEDGAA